MALVRDRLLAVTKDREGMKRRAQDHARQEGKSYEEIMVRCYWLRTMHRTLLLVTCNSTVWLRATPGMSLSVTCTCWYEAWLLSMYLCAYCQLVDSHNLRCFSFPSFDPPGYRVV